MIDTNQKVNPGSVQYIWLEKELANSDATWKFVCHHHPPYSSDENDYGNLWKTNQGNHGDLRARELVPLYEKYGVDIVWNGHIHSYERTWRLLRGKAVQSGGPFYMITGGGGGGLETPAPTRPFFQNNVRRGHHYVMVHINGGTLEMKAFTIDDRLFDYHKIEK
jgi:3',5'-cyclic AMP phosphodiesterase CpdA